MKRVSHWVALVLLLAGCASFPTAGPVNAANPELPQGADIAQQASGPGRDANPRQILEGFLRASAAGFDDDFATARLFLTKEAARAWIPTGSVLIYPTDKSPELALTLGGTASDESASMQLSAPVTGVVDARGVRTSPTSSTPTQLSFELVRDSDGQWRISRLDDGLLLSSVAFQTAFTERTLSFISVDQQAFVPDVRYLPRRRLPTHIVNALLSGPVKWLENAVTTAVPSGAVLTLNSVEVTDGVARVELTTDTSGLSAKDRALLRAQVLQNLTGVPAVGSVVVTVNGASITEREVAPDATRRQGALLAVREGQIVRRDGDKFAPLPLAASVDNPQHPTYVGDRVVFLASGKLWQTTPEGQVTEVGADANLPPSVDRFGWIWAVGPTAAGELQVVQLPGNNGKVLAPWLAASRIRRLAVSPEGTRVAVVREIGTGSRVEVAAVRRDALGVPLSLGDPVVLGEYPQIVEELGWENPTQLLALRQVEQHAVLESLSVGGTRNSVRIKDTAVDLAVSPERGLFISTAAGELYERQGGVWRLLATGIAQPSFGD